MRLEAGVYEGHVAHQRNQDTQHGFSYPLWMALDRLSAGCLPRMIAPNPHHYLTRNTILTKAAMSEVAHREVWLLTQPSRFGRSFNPVTFYFITHHTQITHFIAHITNTPWDETHTYVLPVDPEDERPSWCFDKAFHVSPFLPMDMRYIWRLVVTEQQLNIHMRLERDDEKCFTANLVLQRSTLGKTTPWRLRLQYPCQNLRTLMRIYWQAAKLKIKGVRFYAHPDPIR